MGLERHEHYAKTREDNKNDIFRSLAYSQT